MMRFFARNAGRPLAVVLYKRDPAAPEDEERGGDDALDEALQETFPASDPIAPHQID